MIHAFFKFVCVERVCAVRIIKGRSSCAGSRYARALVDLAVDQKCLDDVARDLRGLQNSLRESEDLRLLVYGGLWSTQVRLRALQAVGVQAGFTPLVMNFLGVLARNGRLCELDSVIDDVFVAIARHRGEVRAEIVSAFALSQSACDEIQTVLSDSVRGSVILDVRVDPSLIGGMVVRVGSRLIDDSIRRKLARLHSVMGRVETFGQVA